MTSLQVRLSGPARKRIEDKSDGLLEVVDSIVHYDETFTDPSEFHRIAVKKSDAQKAESILPNEYTLNHRTWDDWDASLNANAVEITEFASAVADDNESWNVIDVLTLWLQSFNSMRIRRALHSELSSRDVDVRRVD